MIEKNRENGGRMEEGEFDKEVTLEKNNVEWEVQEMRTGQRKKGSDGGGWEEVKNEGVK